MSLNRLAKENFAIIPIFDVVNHTGQSFTYEYVSWRYGPRSGAKGLVFVENDGKPTHFVTLSGEKFATGKRETDCPGGFMDIGVHTSGGYGESCRSRKNTHTRRAPLN
jgi:hypothetical protein